ncbi:hypothetical protein T492DRAFT_89697 [Pavlovales sp. CCMP2436]|nr:hypothetical protein T492DRAFT_89697 [Pavlovales sp. CCMP2436]
MDGETDGGRLHAEERAAVLQEELGAEGLGHDVGDVVEAADKKQLDDAVLDEVADPVEFDVHVLGPAVHDVVLGQVDARNVVLADRRGRSLQDLVQLKLVDEPSLNALPTFVNAQPFPTRSPLHAPTALTRCRRTARARCATPRGTRARAHHRQDAAVDNSTGYNAAVEILIGKTPSPITGKTPLVNNSTGLPPLPTSLPARRRSSTTPPASRRCRHLYRQDAIPHHRQNAAVDPATPPPSTSHPASRRLSPLFPPSTRRGFSHQAPPRPTLDERV